MDWMLGVLRALPFLGVGVLVAASACSTFSGLEAGDNPTFGSSGGASSSSSSSSSSSGGNVNPTGTKGRSCTGGAGADKTCGGVENDDTKPGSKDCCDAQTLPGGTYNRFNNAGFPAKVSRFTLDTFEVTGGRFRAWVEATNGNLRSTAPAAGGGAHPRIPNSGWRTEWNKFLPTSRAEVDKLLGPDESTNGDIGACQFGTNLQDSGALTWWTSALEARVKQLNPNNAKVASEHTKDALDRKPLNCIPWHVLFAFCAWDGGRLPTDAEFGFALAGGSEQRPFPWGPVPDNQQVVLGNQPGLAKVPVFDPFAKYLSARLYDATLGPNVFEQNYAFTYGGKVMGKTDGAAHIPAVGRKPLGNGKWGHADLAGGMWEWMLDEGPIRKGNCDDCANVSWPAVDAKDPNAEMDQDDFKNPGGLDWFVGGARSIRGSAWDNSTGLATGQSEGEIPFYTSYPVLRSYRALGGRCARDL